MEMPQNNEDRQAEAPTIILDTPSTTKMKSWGHWPWKPFVLPTRLPPGQEPTQMGQQKR